MSETETNLPDAITAATVVLLRQRGARVETLMLRKNTAYDFGGMWVFPGGCIEEADFDCSDDLDTAARNAAARETFEETGLRVDSAEFQWFARWTPPPLPRKRFRTWFFAIGLEGDDDVEIDGDEIHEYAWINPARAIERHKEGKFGLVAPTWVTLYHLSQHKSVEALLQNFAGTPVKEYESRGTKIDADTHAVLWHGDAGYEDWDASRPGDRHRLVIRGDQYEFENSVEVY